MMMRLLLLLLSGLFRLQDRLGLRQSAPAGPPSPANLQPAARLESRGCVLAPDGLRLFYRAWLPPGTVRFAALSLHGVAAHGRHFAVVGEHLAPRGGAVYALDLRGHGLSQGQRGDLSDVARVLDDIGAMVDLLKSQHPGVPLFLWGESAGAPLAVRYVSERPTGLAGMVLSCPQLRPTVRPGLTEVLRYLPAVVLRSRAQAVDMTDRLHLCNRDPADIERERTDPLRTNRVSVRTLVAVERLILDTERLSGQITLPTLILQGGHDLVTDPRAAGELYRHLATPPENKRLVVFPEAWHGLLHDPDTPQVLATAAQWFEERVRKAADPEAQ